MKKISNFRQFEKFIHSRIPTREALFMGNIGIKRAKYFMKLIGNPQNKLKIIHIAGTSGKGSTAYLLSNILASQGFKIGLSISPHVFDVRERFQINNKLPNKDLVLKYFNQMLPAIKSMEKNKFGMLTFFEINVAIACLMFAGEGLDYTILETGLGGMLDATNTATNKNKISILTKIGLDHTEILGKTIKKISQQKAAIIHRQNMVISHRSSASALEVIKKKCTEKNSSLCIISKKNYSINSATANKTIFNFKFAGYALKNINLGLIGIHQAENCSLALACLFTLAKRAKFPINENGLRKTLNKIRIPGRMEIVTIEGKDIVMDGAHNPQKMAALTYNLTRMFPQTKFDFIVAFKKGKDFKKMMNLIIPISNKIYLSNFISKNQDNHFGSIDNIHIEKYLNEMDFKNFYTITDLNNEIDLIFKKSKNPIVITGSFHLLTIYTKLKNI